MPNNVLPFLVFRRPDVLRLRPGTGRIRTGPGREDRGPGRQARDGGWRSGRVRQRLQRRAAAPAVVRAQHEERRRLLRRRVQPDPTGRDQNVPQVCRPVRPAAQPVEHERVVQPAQRQADQLPRHRM